MSLWQKEKNMGENNMCDALLFIQQNVYVGVCAVIYTLVKMGEYTKNKICLKGMGQKRHKRQREKEFS